MEYLSHCCGIKIDKEKRCIYGPYGMELVLAMESPQSMRIKSIGPLYGNSKIYTFTYDPLNNTITCEVEEK